MEDKLLQQRQYTKNVDYQPKYSQVERKPISTKFGVIRLKDLRTVKNSKEEPRTKKNIPALLTRDDEYEITEEKMVSRLIQRH